MRITVNVDRGLQKIDLLRTALTDDSVLIPLLSDVAYDISANIQSRYAKNAHSFSGWREDFENKYAAWGRRWYEPNRISAKVLQAVKVVGPHRREVPGGGSTLHVGIGDVGMLNAIRGSSPYAKAGPPFLWQVLEFGSGIFSTMPGATHGYIIREKKGHPQVFGVRSPTARGGKNVGFRINAMRTVSPGQMGRHFIFTMYHSLYGADLQAIERITLYLQGVIAKANSMR